jgi:8-oxo-dGTP pyrophosphatase MutT (NUDIX family)
MLQPEGLQAAGPPIEGQQVAMKAVLYDHAGRVLLVQEAEDYVDASLNGKFCFPGGRMNVGEDPNDALRREVTHEETGLDIIIEEPVDYDWWAPVIPGKPRMQIVGIFVACRQADPTAEVRLNPKEHSSALWVGRAAFARLTSEGRIAPPDDRIIEMFWHNRQLNPA